MEIFRPKPGQSFEDMIKADREERIRIKEAAAKRLESLGVPFVYKTCPKCDFPDITKGMPDYEGVITVTCSICDHVCHEDSMFIKMVLETSFS